MWTYVQYPVPLAELEQQLTAAAQKLAQANAEVLYRKAFFQLVQVMAGAAWWRGYEPLAQAAGRIEKAVKWEDRSVTRHRISTMSSIPARVATILEIVEKLMADPPSKVQLTPAWPAVGHMAQQLPYPFFVVHLRKPSVYYRPTGTGTSTDPLSAKLWVETRVTEMDVRDGYILASDAERFRPPPEVIVVPAVPAPKQVEEEYVEFVSPDGKILNCSADTLCAVYNPASTCGPRGVCMLPKTSAMAKNRAMAEIRSTVSEAAPIEPAAVSVNSARATYAGPEMCTDGYTWINGACQPDPDDPRWANPLDNMDDDDWMPPPPTATDMLALERARDGVDYRRRFEQARVRLSGKLDELREGAAARARAAQYLGARRVATSSVSEAAPAVGTLPVGARLAEPRQRRLGGRRVSGRM